MQTKLCDIDLSRQIPVAIMQHGDTVEYFWDSEGSTVFAHTAIRPDGSVEEQTIPEKFYPNFYDEYAAYDIWGTTCKRLDWQTGDLTTASLPFVQLDSVLGAVGSRVLLTRIVSVLQKTCSICMSIRIRTVLLENQSKECWTGILLHGNNCCCNRCRKSLWKIYL